MLTQNRQKISLAALAASLIAMAAAMPARADTLPGAGLSVCLSLDKMVAFREGELKLWRKAAADLGIKLVEQVAGEDAQRQSSQIDTCIAQKVNGIVAIPWDNQAVLQDIERAHAAGIPFVTVDQAPADTSTVDTHIGGDPTADGLHAGQRLVALVGDKPTTVVDLQGALSAVNGQERDKGFKEGIKDHPNIKMCTSIVDYLFRVLALEYLGQDEFAQVKPAEGDTRLRRGHGGKAHDLIYAAQCTIGMLIHVTPALRTVAERDEAERHRIVSGVVPCNENERQ